MNYEIQEALAEDFSQVGQLYTQSWQKTYRGLLPDALLDRMTAQDSTEKWVRYCRQANQYLFCAKAEGQLVGFAACKPCTMPQEGLLLDSLHVAPGCGGQGIGSCLIRRCARLARELGHTRLVVYVVKGNDRAQRLYQHLGAQVLFDFFDPVDGAPSWALSWDQLSRL